MAAASNRRRRVVALAAGAALLLVLAPLVLDRVPEGRALLRPVPGGVPQLTVGPAWSLHVPFRSRPLWLDLSPAEAHQRLEVGGTTLDVTAQARPDPAGSAADLWELATAGVRGALGDALRQAAGAAGSAEEAALRSSVEAQLGARGLTLVSLTANAVAPASRRETAAPGGGSPDLDVVLIGIDSADWDRVDPLIAAGDLPNLARLRREGAWARLKSDVPTLSPLLWTTVVTGRPPDEHGVVDFVMVDPASGVQTPISSSFRRVKALWNIFTDAGLSVGVVGWWATWPAEPVEGVMVSDRVAFSLFHLQEGERAQGVTYPASYFDRVAELRVNATDIGLDEVRRFADVTPADFAESTRLLEQGGSEAAYRHPVASLRKILASTHTYHNIAKDLLSRGQPRWFAVYYEGLDEVNHRFGHLNGEAHPLADPEDRRRYGRVIDAFYEFQDELVGELLALLSSRSVVMVLSDHGFANGAERPPDLLPYVEAGRPGRWHTLDGIWLLWGPPVRPGPLTGPPVRLDQITPTILRLLDQPIAEDMPGPPLEDALLPQFVDRHPIRHIATYERTEAPVQAAPAVAGNQGTNAEMLARLRALGYLAPESPGTAGRDASSTVTANYHANLGSIFAGRGELDRAREEFQRALELTPGHLGARGGLIQIDLAQGRLDQALEGTLDLLASNNPLMDRVFYFVAAYLHAETGRTEAGLELFDRLAREHPEIDQVFTGLGLLRQAAGDVDGAVEAYHRALDLRPTALYALQELYSLETGPGSDTDVLERCRRAIESAPDAVMPYNWQALVLRRSGRTDEAERSFREALSRDPDSVRTLVNLSSLLVDVGRPGEAVPLLRRALERDASSWEARVNLVVALGRDGRLAEAETVFREAAGDPPPELLNAMAFAYYLNAAPERARGLLERSLGIDPSQAEARRLLAALDRPAPGS